jgi:hypothetical protein
VLTSRRRLQGGVKFNMPVTWYRQSQDAAELSTSTDSLVVNRSPPSERLHSSHTDMPVSEPTPAKPIVAKVEEIVVVGNDDDDDDDVSGPIQRGGFTTPSPKRNESLFFVV